MASAILATEFVMAQTEIVGNVDSKRIIISETAVYGNPVLQADNNFFG